MTEESATSMWAFMTSWFTPTFLFVFLNLTIGTIAVTSAFGTQKKQQQQQQQQQPGGDEPPQLARAPSLLERLKSFNFSHYRFEEDPNTFPSITTTSLETETQHTELADETRYQTTPPQPRGDEPPQLARAPSLLERVKSFNFSLYRFEDPKSFPSNTTTTTLETETQVTQHKEPADETLDHSQPHDHHVARSKSDTKPASSGKVPAKMKKSASVKPAFGRSEVEEGEAVERRRPATARTSETSSFGDDEEVDAKADDFINRFKQQLKLQRLDSLLRYKEMLSRGAGK